MRQRPRHFRVDVERQHAVLAAAALLGVVGEAQAQADFPNRPITMVVPFTAGSTSDISARLVAQKISGPLGQTVVVENRPGANGQIAMQAVARAKPEPDLFFACQRKLGVEPRDCYVIGDAVWDLLAARRAGMLSIGLLTGGYGEDELSKAGAYRVYRDAAELHRSLDELGVLP